MCNWQGLARCCVRWFGAQAGGGFPRFFVDIWRLRSDRLPGVRSWTSSRFCTWSCYLPSIQPHLGGRRSSRYSRSCIFMKQHCSVLGKEVSDGEGGTDWQHCSLHGEFSASEDRAGRCGWCLRIPHSSWLRRDLTWLRKTLRWTCGCAKLKT